MNDTDTLNVIQSKLEIELDKKKAEIVSDLNEISLTLIDQCKKLKDPYEIECFLKPHVTEDNYRYLRAFVNAVVLRGKDPKKWRAGRVLVPSASLNDQMGMLLDDFYGSKLVDFSLIIEPDYSDWSQGLGTVGCFVILEPDANYRCSNVSGFSSLHEPQNLKKVDPVNRRVWFRRWIANRMARYLLAKEALHSFQNETLLVELVSKNNWTVDAVAAFSGLLKEKELNKWSGTVIPGYLGDDSFYV
jgi:hypothetical protein